MFCEFLYFFELVILRGVGAIVSGLYLFVGGFAHFWLFASLTLPEQYGLL